MHHTPIAVFDSGIGGLTVLRVLANRFPHESFIYLGDTARLPYGTKSPETVALYAAQMAATLMTYQPKAMVIACNTASALGVHAVRDVVGNVPVIEMIAPATKNAVAATRNNHIAILGTNGTIRSGAYAASINAARPDITVTALPCQLLVALAEEGWVDHPATLDIVQTYLAPILAGPMRPDTVILGCTHFPLFLPLFKRLMPGTTFIHCGDAAADALEPLILANKTTSIKGQLQFMATDGIANFTRHLDQFFGTRAEPDQVRLVDPLMMAA